MSGYQGLLGPVRGPIQTKHAAGFTPQHTVLKGREADMHRNAAGGYVFTLDDWSILRRFLVLGSTTNTYYASAEQLSDDAMKLIDRALATDPIKFVDTVVEVSVSGAPLKQSSCIFALARACSNITGDAKRDTDNKDPVTKGRTYALAEAPKVLRTNQHVFEFLDYCRRQRGGGSGLLKLLAGRVLNPDLGQVEYQALKYRTRVGWSPRDLLRYAHPKTGDAERDNLFAWLVKPESEKGRLAVQNSERLAAFEELQGEVSVSRAVELITANRMTHEFVPNTLLGERDIWAALLPNLPVTALVRNLRKMTQVGLLVDGSEAVKIVRDKLTNADVLKKARLHPLRVMFADRSYRGGTSRWAHGADFVPSGQVLGILEDALEVSFSAVEPLNRRTVVAVDSSGSMSQTIGDNGLFTAFEAGLLFAMWYKRTEADCTFLTFHGQTQLQSVSDKVRYQELLKIGTPGGTTDMSSPLKWINDKGLDPEHITIVTDNVTWSGYRSHPTEELARIRKRVKHPVAVSYVATTLNNGTCGDPKDPHMLSVVGFDATVTEAIAAHVKEVFNEG